MAIYVTSDLHIGHDKEFVYKSRGFENIFDHDNAIIENFNKVLTDDDDLYILGDLMLNDNKHGMSIINRIPGRKHIAIGNHDTDSRLEMYPYLRGYEEASYAFNISYKGYNFYLTHYPTLTSNRDIDKSLCRKVINIAGHSHTNDKFIDMDKGLIYHVELDAHNMAPVKLDDVIEDITNLYTHNN